MAELFHKTFAVNLSEFSSTTASNGTIAQSSGAGLNGTTGGVLCTATAASPNLYGIVDHVLSGASAFRLAFYLDMSSVVIGTNGQLVTLWIAYQLPVAIALGMIRIVRISGALKLRFIVISDAGGLTTTDVALSGFPSWIEVSIVPESTDGAADGITRYYIGGGDYPTLGVLAAEFLAQENYNSFQAVNEARMGFGSGGSTVSGTFIIDEIIARNDNTPIIYGVEESTRSLRGMRYVLKRRRRKSCYW